MKALKILEKSKSFWYLLSLSLFFFILRLPSLIEPNWYGDEGIYQVIGLAMNRNRMLYSQIWDNKPPLLYIVYAFFHGDQFQVRLFSLISGLLAVVVFFKLTQLLFKQLKVSIISTILFVLLFGTPLLEGNIANAENFMLLPIIAAGYLVYKISIKNYTVYAIRNTLILAGLLLGVSFLFKIVAVFDLAAFCLFLIIVSFPDKFSNSFSKIKSFIEKDLKPILILLFGFIIPLSVTVLYFLINHAFSDFTRAVFFSNVGYVGYGNKLIIPQGLLILKLLVLASVTFFVFLKRKFMSEASIFIIIWFAFSLFNTFFSGRPYTHYTLVTAPSLCLLIGLMVTVNKQREKFIYLLILIFTTIILCVTFKPNVKKSVSYYENAVSFLMNKKDVISYQTFFDHKTPRDYDIASFIRTHTSSTDNVFIWGDSAQIYALSGKIPPGKYTVAYHITQSQMAFSQTQSDLNTANPKYIITFPESHAIPFSLSQYGARFVFNDVVIYERTL